jgi:hypothetical protein
LKTERLLWAMKSRRALLFNQAETYLKWALKKPRPVTQSGFRLIN